MPKRLSPTFAPDNYAAGISDRSVPSRERERPESLRSQNGQRREAGILQTGIGAGLRDDGL